MSDTTGWEKSESGKGLIKQIGKIHWCAYQDGDDAELWIGGVTIATRDTLEECQILAHDTARLWAGESE